MLLAESVEATVSVLSPREKNGYRSVAGELHVEELLESMRQKDPNMLWISSGSDEYPWF